MSRAKDKKPPPAWISARKLGTHCPACGSHFPHGDDRGLRAGLCCLHREKPLGWCLYCGDDCPLLFCDKACALVFEADVGLSRVPVSEAS